MILLIVQSVSAALALFLSLQGLTEVADGSAVGALKATCCPLVWLYLARKLDSFYAACGLLLGGLFIAVVLMPSVTLPAVFNSDDRLFTSIGLASFLALNLWSAYHARWAQLVLFKNKSVF